MNIYVVRSTATHVVTHEAGHNDASDQRVPARSHSPRLGRSPEADAVNVFVGSPEELAAAASRAEKAGALRGSLNQLSELVDEAKAQWRGGASNAFSDVAGRWGEAMGRTAATLDGFSEAFDYASAKYTSAEETNKESFAINWGPEDTFHDGRDKGDGAGDGKTDDGKTATEAAQPVGFKDKLPVKETPPDLPQSPDYPGVNPAQFRDLYGRLPQSDADWKMAQVLDTNTLVGRNNGVPAQEVVGKFKPVPGQGIVRMDLYIPANNVFNLPQNDLGDGRGPQQQFDPRQTRVSIYIDYENGVVVARQNPSVAGVDQVQVATPSVDVQETSDGRLRISCDAANPFSPSIASSAGWSVNGDITLTPSANGVQVDGTVGKYPSMEVYQDRQGSTTTVHQYQATGSEYGPMADLPKPNNIGTGDHGPLDETKPGYQTWDYADPGAQTHVTEIVVPGKQMKLGPADAPPRIDPVEPSPPSARNTGAI